MLKWIYLVYGILAYAVFFLTFIYSVLFVGNIYIPYPIDAASDASIISSIIINCILLSIFAVQHTVMARPKFKSFWTTIVPQQIERSTYVWLSNLTLIILFIFWQPIEIVIWDFQGNLFGIFLTAMFWFGWFICLAATFMLDHFDLFGLKQVYFNLRKRKVNEMAFKEVLFYRLVRHPIMTGFIIGFWATPVMSLGHLLFAIATTGYIYVAVKYFEEKDLVKSIGPEYIKYQQRVGMLLPYVGKKSDT
jgi:protein-S-isoprenylcysteine O-methyltransferase Ste14